MAPALAEMITELWMATPFKGRQHQQRLDQIAALERGERLSGDRDAGARRLVDGRPRAR